MCRALKVLCVAPDAETLAALKRATVSADWELAPGATDDEHALTQLHEERPHVLVVFGRPFDGFVRRALDAYPALRVVADHDVEGAAATVAGLDEVRDVVLGRSRPGSVT
jgi:hypothetical protein